eukprot:2834620-Pyramimonas_sp.AAC.1
MADQSQTSRYYRRRYDNSPLSSVLSSSLARPYIECRNQTPSHIFLKDAAPVADRSQAPRL